MRTYFLLVANGQRIDYFWLYSDASLDNSEITDSDLVRDTKVSKQFINIRDR